MKTTKGGKAMEVAKTKQKVRAKESGEVVKFDEAGMPQLDVWLGSKRV